MTREQATLSFKESFPQQVNPKEDDRKINEQLFWALGLSEFNENVEKLYASTIFMSSTCCASWTCD